MRGIIHSRLRLTQSSYFASTGSKDSESQASPDFKMNPPPPPPPPPPNNPNARPTRPRSIRGPQSALTDFLAAHNIDANQIRQDANARRAAAVAAQQAADGNANNDNPDGDENEEMTSSESEETPAPRRQKETNLQTKKRKKDEEKAIAKIKASKRFQKRRRLLDSDGEITDEEEAARALFEESLAPLPAQMENCEICDKRFTVTPYTRTGPDGGLVCQQCAKELDKEEGAAKKKRKTAAGRQRRKVQSDLLDGIYPGAKDLMTLCIETLAKNVHLAEDFGDLPAPLIDRLSAIICKKRLLKSDTLNLFLQSGRDTVKITDAAYLSSDDFIRIFQWVPTIKTLKLRNAIQFKDTVMDHLIGSPVELEHISLHGTNLIGDDTWDKFMKAKAASLKSFKLYWTDGYFGDDQIEQLTKTCPNLERLKIEHNQKVTGQGIKQMAQFSKLEQLALELYRTSGQKHPASASIVEVLDAVGPGLRRLSLAQFHYIVDSVLQAIHDNCQNLTKLRITCNEKLTDAAFAAMFTGWLNPPLTFVDFNKCTHVDASEPRENPDSIGLCSEGFKAMIAHSGKTLRYINIHSCRHISLEAFESAFSHDKIYPDLKKMDISFCQEVNDFVVGSIFKSCPALKELIIFGNFKVQHVKVPKGRILIGMPNAMGMQIEGADDNEEGGGTGATAW